MTRPIEKAGVFTPALRLMLLFCYAFEYEASYQIPKAYFTTRLGAQQSAVNGEQEKARHEQVCCFNDVFHVLTSLSLLYIIAQVDSTLLCTFAKINQV